MNNNNYSTENVYKKGVGSKKTQKNMLDIYIQMIIDEALFMRKKELLQNEIDRALELRDRDRFNSLSIEYRKLLETN